MMKNLNHVHEVLQMLAVPSSVYSRKSLEQEIKSTFGEDAIFVNCSDQDLGPSEVIDFILTKGKVEEKDGLLMLISSPCDH